MSMFIDCSLRTMPVSGRGARYLRSRRLVGGFTLVELLVVMMILAILSGMVLMALAGAQEAARRARTQATVTKLNGLIMNKWEEYKTRRVPLDTSAMSPSLAATSRLNMLREIMRLEMPSSFMDIKSNPVTPGLTRPAVSLSYLDALDTAKHPGVDPVGPYQGAKCLYLIITKLCDDGRDAFQDSELATTVVIDPGSTDPMPFFVDGWGHPIGFIRWPSGMIYPYSELQSGDAVNDHDQFDYSNVYPGDYATYPLIYSWGPDGQPGVITHQNATTVANSPFIKDGSGLLEGAVDTVSPSPNTSTSYADNIHNHLIGAR